MKRLIFAAALAAATIPVLGADVGVSISIGDPGFYGRLDIGDYPRPQVIYRRAVAIERVPVSRPPIYLRVPPGHAKNWRRHCHKYDACGERVYFVQSNWYNREYVPRYRERHGDGRDGRRDERRGDQRWDERDDRHGDDRYRNR
ncbi:hypothetical protein [Aromatoleum diolicum]|uniref:Uncharacterized protein n=1 Tax=Aromatoleum diolicum TaxID=75796 RepID=A0ABX1Q936_9RHOO|nr:hypothetical protein [Aromatoleum diolicum]NMG74022.1 hypothetical protein [Aromatoleum diolicum]